MKHIFYHGSDLDGMCSGVIMQKYCDNKAQVYPWEYAYQFPEEFNPTFDDTVYFVDMTANPYERILELTKKTNVVVIDHHKSFIEWAEKNVPTDILKTWRLDISKAACVLCWEYANPGVELPHIVKLLGLYDIWDNKDVKRWDEVILPFQFGIRGIKFEDALWNIMLDSRDLRTIDFYIDKGKIIIEYTKAANASVVRKHSFAAKLAGHDVIACNTQNFSSQTFETVWDASKYEFMMAFTLSKGTEYWCSLYTTRDDVDVSKIASAFGGGGHAKAAGFQAKSLTVKLGVIEIEPSFKKEA